MLFNGKGVKFFTRQEQVSYPGLISFKKWPEGFLRIENLSFEALSFCHFPAKNHLYREDIKAILKQPFGKKWVYYNTNQSNVRFFWLKAKL